MTSINKNIFLTGFMGAGKSTIGPILANTIGWNFYDLDKLIEQNTNKKIKDIFTEHGEAYFRKLEQDLLKNTCASSNTVLALGGGTIINPENFQIIKSSGVLVYLKTDKETIFKRLQHKRDRPSILIEDEEDFNTKLKQKIEKLMEERDKYYIKADIILDTTALSIGFVIDKLIAQLKLFVKFD